MRVNHVIRYDAGLYRGGGEIKAERTREALAGLGVDVSLYGPQTQELGELVHFFGSMGYFWTIAEHCRRLGVPYVCSPIFVTPRSPGRLRWRAFRLRLLQGKSNLSRLFAGAQGLYFQTEREQTNFEAFYGPTPQARVIPNGVESRFAHGDPARFRAHFGIEGPIVLQTGTLGPNKHPLALIQAMEGSEKTLVLLGQESDAAYAKACRKAAGGRVRFLDRLPHDDPLLSGAYAAAEIFCLPSSDDIFANAAMEAAVAGCRLILGDSWGGQAIYGDWAAWVEPGNVAQIRDALRAADHRPHQPEAQRQHFLERYSWDSVAALLMESYATIVKS